MDSVSIGAFSPALQAEWLTGLTIPTTGYMIVEVLRQTFQ